MESIQDEAARQEIEVFTLSTGEGGDRDSFFRAAREILPMDPPLESSRSWEALSDSLWEGLFALSSSQIAIIWRDADRHAEAALGDIQTAQAVLQDVAEMLMDPQATGGNPKKLSIFIESNT
ncbi:barstar family protein [Streptomyces sp. NPDC048340]|uniref:barstar family protein n=1 Tax=Streptomyces sp. NPDC048340 TaxID=3365537 RepID=UPI003718C7B7